ncbi:dihydrolipoamide acetyltransferase family protein [Pikeienuella sp. HZG-20]|uniref:dihydrolipoamide acetyltransferase family protein n=1 Tax=Paludibacillus litoralis TaxID=3133267 RepID=UPI0030EEB9EB
MADLLMPKFGLTMTEGLLTEWRIAPGAAFKAGDPLFTVETEKVANEVEAEADGVLAEVLVQEGESAPVGAPVARLAGAAHGGEKAPSPAPESARPARILATPLARRLARNSGVDLAALRGSGPRGRIKAADVQGAAPAPRPAAAPPGAAAGSGAGIAPDAARLATARKVAASWREVPHFHVTHEAEITALTTLRAELNADADRRGARVSLTHMLIRALGVALAEAPALNRVWAEERIIAFDRVDIGMVVETPQGLRIPVVRDAGAAALDEIAARADDLAARARAGALTPADVGGGVASISNVGMFGASALAPIINPPNAMMLGVGADRALFRPDAAGAPALRRELTLTLACDHRIVDGAEAARFLSGVVAILESPLRLLRPAHGPN